MKKEIPYIHVVRALACIMVVCLHSLPAPELYVFDGVDASFMHFVRILTKPCVPLFFMITGVLMFPYKSEMDFIGFYKKRIPRVLYPLLFWGIIYAILPFVLGMCDLSSMLRELVLSPVMCPSQIGGILWYLFILIGIYLIIPFINQNVYQDKKMIKVYLFVWLVSSIVLVFKPVFPELLGQNTWVQNFDLTIYFSGYLGYLFLGYYLNVFNILGGGKIYFLLWVFLLPLMYLKGGACTTFLHVGTVLMSLSLFVFFKNGSYYTNGFMYELVKKISSASFGIYLCQMMIYRVLTIKIYINLGTEWYIQLIVMILTFLGAYALSFVLSKLPFKKYIIG